MLLNEELTKIIEGEIKFGATKIIFCCDADRDDFIQNCWLSILLYVDNRPSQNNVTRLAIKGKIKNEMIKYFNSNSKSVDLFNDEIRYREKKDVSDEIIENEQKKTEKADEEIIMEIIEEQMPCGDDLNKKAINPRFHSLSKKIDYSVYREVRNKREYLIKKFIKNVDKIFLSDICANSSHRPHG